MCANVILIFQEIISSGQISKWEIRKVFEPIIMKWVDGIIDGELDSKQFGGTSTTDVLVEMLYRCYEATDTLDIYVRVAMLDLSKVFYLILDDQMVEYFKEPCLATNVS